jgi:hypothetical protein
MFFFFFLTILYGSGKPSEEEFYNMLKVTVMASAMAAILTVYACIKE